MKGVEIISEYLHVAQIHSLMKPNNGVMCATDPVFCTLVENNEEFYAVVKFNNNIQGNLSLINELCAARICSVLGLALPQSGICFIDQRTILSEQLRIDVPSFSERNFGPAFYSRYCEKAIPAAPRLFGRVDVQQLANMILLDHLIYNCDRHNGNVMIEIGKGFKFYIIDHSHIFKNGCIWDAELFRQGISQNDYLDGRIYEENGEIYSDIMLYAHPNRQNFEDGCKAFQRELTPEVIHSIITEIPDIWKKGLQDDLDALEGYINYRIENFEHITKMIMEKGGL